MSEHEYWEAIETMRRECKAKVRKYESSRDYWKFTAITLFFVSLFWILDLLGCFPDSN
jgi:hypothetical protein